MSSQKIVALHSRKFLSVSRHSWLQLTAFLITKNNEVQRRHSVNRCILTIFPWSPRTPGTPVGGMYVVVDVGCVWFCVMISSRLRPLIQVSVAELVDNESDSSNNKQGISANVRLIAVAVQQWSLFYYSLTLSTYKCQARRRRTCRPQAIK